MEDCPWQVVSFLEGNIFRKKDTNIDHQSTRLDDCQNVYIYIDIEMYVHEKRKTCELDFKTKTAWVSSHHEWLPPLNLQIGKAIFSFQLQRDGWLGKQISPEDSSECHANLNNGPLRGEP